MKIKYLAVALMAVFLAAGCSDNAGEDVDVAELVKGKTFYEADNNKTTKYWAHTFDDDYYTAVSYNDEEFSDVNRTQKYEVIKYKKEELEVKRDGIEYLCTFSDELDVDKNKIIELGMDCDPKEEDADADFISFIKAYPTKQEALDNMD